MFLRFGQASGTCYGDKMINLAANVFVEFEDEQIGLGPAQKNHLLHFQGPGIFHRRQRSV